MFDPIITLECMELTSILCQVNKPNDIPTVYRKDGEGPFWLSYRWSLVPVFYTPFYYKGIPVGLIK